MKYILALLIGSSITVQATDYFIGGDIGLGGELEGFDTDLDLVDFSIQAGIDLGGASYDNNFSTLLFFEYSSGDDSVSTTDVDYDSYTINTAFTYKYNKVV